MERSTGTGAAPGDPHRQSGPSVPIRLASATETEIEEVLDRSDLTEPDVLAILLNRRATRQQVQRIAGDPRWNRTREIVRRVFQHPNAPVAFATRSMPYLRWTDLADALDRPWLHPTLRARAEQALRGRVEEMALGEQVALARRAGRRALPVFFASREERVLVSLIGNSRLREAEVARLAADRTVPPGFLRELARHGVWGARRSVRLAIAGNPRSPAATALGTLGGMAEGDLRRLANDGNVPRIVRVGASRAIPEQHSKGGSAQPVAPGLCRRGNPDRGR